MSMASRVGEDAKSLFTAWQTTPLALWVERVFLTSMFNEASGQWTARRADEMQTGQSIKPKIEEKREIGGPERLRCNCSRNTPFIVRGVSQTTLTFRQLVRETTGRGRWVMKCEIDMSKNNNIAIHLMESHCSVQIITFHLNKQVYPGWPGHERKFLVTWELGDGFRQALKFSPLLTYT